MDWTDRIDAEKIVEWRRWFHSHAELSFEEYETSDKIAALLNEMPNLEVIRPIETSVVAILRGAYPGNTIGLRADIDALPIEEEADVPFKSLNAGVMHACGHDTHAAMLLGAADALSAMKDQLHGTVKFIFQAAEEAGDGGAAPLCETGALDDVDSFFALHITPLLSCGMAGSKEGPFTTSYDEFTVNIKGRGSHGSMPYAAIDPLTTGASLIIELNQIVSSSIDSMRSAVLTVGMFRGGEALNVIPDTAELGGTIRTADPESRRIIEERVRAIVAGVCMAHGAEYDLRYAIGQDSVINDPECFARAKRVIEQCLGEDSFELSEMLPGSDDYSEYGRIAPQVYLFLGAAPENEEDIHTPHHPKFQINEAALPQGAMLYAGYALEYLGQ